VGGYCDDLGFLLTLLLQGNPGWNRLATGFQKTKKIESEGCDRASKQSNNYRLSDAGGLQETKKTKTEEG
jgi:hypothetical protein